MIMLPQSLAAKCKQEADQAYADALVELPIKRSVTTREEKTLEILRNIDWDAIISAENHLTNGQKSNADTVYAAMKNYLDTKMLEFDNTLPSEDEQKNIFYRFRKSFVDENNTLAWAATNANMDTVLTGILETEQASACKSDTHARARRLVLCSTPLRTRVSHPPSVRTTYKQLTHSCTRQDKTLLPAGWEEKMKKHMHEISNQKKTPSERIQALVVRWLTR